MRECIIIPLTTEEIIMKLTKEQAGRLFQAALVYAFEYIKPDFSDDPVLEMAFIDFIKQCRKKGEKGNPEFITMGYTETFENYEEE